MPHLNTAALLPERRRRKEKETTTHAGGTIPVFLYAKHSHYLNTS
jgi:hypothetical protein